MDLKSKIFNKKYLPIDEFVDKILYDPQNGYYVNHNPFNKQGDYITSPNISPIFSEIVSIWIVSLWEKLGKPKKINIVELGPGNGEMTRVLLKSLKKFLKINSFEIFLYEKSISLEKLQKKRIKDPCVKWINDFNKIRSGPVIFIGNEFFDAVPIKQFQKKNNVIKEKNLFLEANKIKNKYLKISKNLERYLNKFKTINSNKFFEFPLKGLKIMDIIIKVIKRFNGAILLIDYGYTIKSEQSSLQSVKNHKYNKLFSNLGDADISSLVNFKLLEEYFNSKKLKVNNIIDQGKFLKTLGIIERADILSKNMNFKDKADLYYRVKRLIHPKEMGSLFKVIQAFSHK